MTTSNFQHLRLTSDYIGFIYFLSLPIAVDPTIVFQPDASNVTSLIKPLPIASNDISRTSLPVERRFLVEAGRRETAGEQNDQVFGHGASSLMTDSVVVAYCKALQPQLEAYGVSFEVENPGISHVVNDTVSIFEKTTDDAWTAGVWGESFRLVKGTVLILPALTSLSRDYFSANAAQFGLIETVITI